MVSAKKIFIMSAVFLMILFATVGQVDQAISQNNNAKNFIPSIWFDSDRNVGLTPAIPHFYAVPFQYMGPGPGLGKSQSLFPMEWWMGDGTKTRYYGPTACHEFWNPKSPYDRDSTYRIQFNGLEVRKFITLYQPDPECNYAHLQFVDGSTSHAVETWDNAVDGDTWGWDGTASISYDETGRPWAIFEFTDQQIHKITKIRMMNDTGVGALERHTRWFNISVSTTGTDVTDFTVILNTSKINDKNTPLELEDDWASWDVPLTDAKYVKIVILSPNTTYWRQLGELEVWEQIDIPDAGQSTLEASGTPKADGIEEADITLTLKDKDGNPMTGKTELYNIGIYSVGMECSGKDMFEPITETATPGVYTTKMTSIWPSVKTLRAVVDGVVIGDAQVTFLTTITVEEPPPPANYLVFLEGSEAYPKEGWDNAVDGDFNGWDGTTTARASADPSQPAWAIYRFGDDFLYQFNLIYIQTDNGIADPNVVQRWAGDIEVLVSTTGTDEPDFISIARIHRYWGVWSHTVLSGMVQAKYVKIMIHSAVQPAQQWYQLTEFQLHTPTKTGPEVVPAVDAADVMALPETFGLDQNYPNPFNPETSIRYTLAEDVQVTLKVFDVNGRQVATLVDERQNAGMHTAIWNAANMPSGMYFYKLNAGTFQQVKRMALVK